MDPNNNQPINTQPVQQPAPVPQQPPVVPTPIQQQPQPTPAPVPAQDAPKGRSKKGLILILVLLILVAGMAYYVFFAMNQTKTIQESTTDNTSVVVPTATVAPIATPTPASVDDIKVENPDADLKSVENDVLGL